MRAAPRHPVPAIASDTLDLMGGLAILGMLGIAWGTIAQPAATWSGLLTAAIFGLTLALGGALFLALQVVCGARWWLPIRRVPLLLARTLPMPLVALGLCLLAGLTVLYPWARPDVVAASALLQRKAAWLQTPYFLARAALIVTIWLALIAMLHRCQARAERPESPAWDRLVRRSVVFLVLFAITLSVASWDWIMSLEPEWYSTIYAVYVFAGCVQGGLAAIILIAAALERQARIDPVPEPVRQDLARLLFAFSTFWAYVWFCQMMLIWYSNLPEETRYFATRWDGGWTMFFFLNLALGWILPFATLLSVGARRHRAALNAVAAVVLLGRFLDCHLLVAPSLGPAASFPLAAVVATAVVVIGMLLYGRRLLRGEEGA